MAAVAQEQVGAERLLELVNLVAQRRLSDVKARGSTAEMELLRDGQEIAEQARLEVDRARLSLAWETGLGHGPRSRFTVIPNATFGDRRRTAAMSITTVTSL